MEHLDDQSGLARGVRDEEHRALLVPHRRAVRFRPEPHARPSRGQHGRRLWPVAGQAGRGPDPDRRRPPGRPRHLRRGHATYQAGAAWSLNDGATIFRANYGEGFKAPSLYQLYSDYGNTSLKPEEAKSWDIGVEHSVLDGRLRGSIICFSRDTKNQIDFLSNNTPPNFGGYASTAKTQADGASSWKAASRSTPC